MKNDIKTIIMHQIFNHFVKSNDFNGLNISVIESNNHSWSDVRSLLVELIEEGCVNIISSKQDDNIYINRFGVLPIKDQIIDLNTSKGNRNICCYPSPIYLTTHRDVSEFRMFPFKEMLALGTPQLLLQYFEWDVLDKYSEDPRFDFKFRDYEGEISSANLLSETEYIYIKTFGTGRDSENKKVVAVYPRYLVEMSSANQIHWYSKIVDRNKCKIIQAYQDNNINCCWHFPDSVYTAILKEMNNINQITDYIWNCMFFEKNYLSERPQVFGTIFKPTLIRYNAFILVFEKIVPNNINPSFFDKVHIDKKNPDGSQKGTINRLREWLKIINKDIENDITRPIRKIRELRQAPAHKIESNIYDYSYFDKQQEIIQELLESLILFRRLFLTHPKAENFIIEHKNDNIIAP